MYFIQISFIIWNTSWEVRSLWIMSIFASSFLVEFFSFVLFGFTFSHFVHLLSKKLWFVQSTNFVTTLNNFNSFFKWKKIFTFLCTIWFSVWLKWHLPKQYVVLSPFILIKEKLVIRRRTCLKFFFFSSWNKFIFVINFESFWTKFYKV